MGSDHYPVVISIGVAPSTAGFRKRSTWKFGSGTWENWTAALQQPELEGMDDLQRKFTNFTSNLIQASHKVFKKTKEYTQPKNNKPWWNSKCADAVKAKQEAEIVLINQPSPVNLIAYKRCQALVKQEVKNAKKESWISFCNSITTDTFASLIWKHIKNLQTPFCKKAQPILTNNAIITDSVSKANALADHYQERLTSPSPSPFPQHNLIPLAIALNDDTPSVINDPFNIQELNRGLTSMRSTTTGHDDIHNEHLKHMPDNYKTWLLQLYNKSLQSGMLPTVWQPAIIIPLPKPNKPLTSVDSYRPISLLSCVQKLMERLIVSRLTFFLEQKGVFRKTQGCYRRRLSAIHQVTKLEAAIRSTLIKTKCAFSSCLNDRGKCPDMVFFRFPVDPKRCLKWIINSRRRDLEAVYMNCTDKHFFFRNYIMCAAHFSQCCFMSNECKRLVHNAVPTLFTIDANNPLKFFEPSHDPLQFENDAEAGTIIAQGRVLDVQIMAEIDKREDPAVDTSYFTFCLEHSHHDSDYMPGILESKIYPPMLPISFPKEEEEDVDEESGNFYFACCAPACISTSTDSVLYVFPDDFDLAKSWLESCRREDLLELLQLHGSMPGNLVLCSLHFSSGYFLNSNALVFNALPRAVNASYQSKKTASPIRRKSERGVRVPSARLKGNSVKVVATEKLLQLPLTDSNTGLYSGLLLAFLFHVCTHKSCLPLSCNKPVSPEEEEEEEVLPMRQRLRRRTAQTLRRLAACRDQEESEDPVTAPTTTGTYEERQLRRKDETLRRLAACRGSVLMVVLSAVTGVLYNVLGWC
ncbi:Zinc finger C2CH-type [Trinorchestia longiramus]|nr:Zinc finger C2CH-type [Trinorchestia longiramus]